MSEELEREKADLRMCFDYISQVRDFEFRARQHNITLLILALGVISWVFFSNTTLNIIIQLVLICLFGLFIVLIIYVNLVKGKTDRQCNTIQALILNGKISNSKEFIESFDNSIPRTRRRIKNWTDSALDIVGKEKSEK